MHIQNITLVEIKQKITSHRLVTSSNSHRLPVIIHADKKELKILCENFKSEFNHSILIDENNTLKANDIIGHEYDAIIYYLDQHVDPNLFAAISGTLRSGGIFLVLQHNGEGQYDKSKINREIDYFSQYLINAIFNNKDFLKVSIEERKVTYIEPELDPALELKNKINILDDAFSQQRLAVTSISKVLTGHRRRPLVLTANRGRGKSAAIGIAIGEIIKKKLSSDSQQEFSILVTAPSTVAAAVIFKHIKITLPEVKLKNNSININTCSVSFISPDNLVHNLPHTDLLIVEEAAGHHLHVLNTLLKHYSRIVFATTLHGYEGSGQGFMTRFTQSLNTVTPNWKSLTLKHPIRWATQDPLENFIDNTFLLSKEPLPIKAEGELLNKIKTNIFTHSELIKNIELLESIFCLLKSAHYKTSPNDLRQLMNAKDAIIFTSTYNNTLIAAAIIEKEGNIPDNLAHDIYKGKRRPKGQLIPQSIIMHLGLIEAAKLSFLRIMRIAVLPDFQNKNIGSHLTNEIITYGKQQSIDCIGTSFGATSELLNFWFTFDFHTLRLGYKKNTFSGTNAVLMIKPMSNTSITLSYNADTLFFNNFIAQLSNALNNVETSIIHIILNKICTTPKSSHLSDKIHADVKSFILYHRSFDDNLSSISAFVIDTIQHTHHFSSLNNTQASIIILKIFQHKSWHYVCEKLGFSGKKQALKVLKSSILILTDQ